VPLVMPLLETALAAALALVPALYTFLIKLAAVVAGLLVLQYIYDMFPGRYRKKVLVTVTIIAVLLFTPAVAFALYHFDTGQAAGTQTIIVSAFKIAGAVLLAGLALRLLYVFFTNLNAFAEDFRILKRMLQDEGYRIEESKRLIEADISQFRNEGRMPEAKAEGMLRTLEENNDHNLIDYLGLLAIHIRYKLLVTVLKNSIGFFAGAAAVSTGQIEWILPFFILDALVRAVLTYKISKWRHWYIMFIGFVPFVGAFIVPIMARKKYFELSLLYLQAKGLGILKAVYPFKKGARSLEAAALAIGEQIWKNLLKVGAATFLLIKLIGFKNILIIFAVIITAGWIIHAVLQGEVKAAKVTHHLNHFILR